MNNKLETAASPWCTHRILRNWSRLAAALRLEDSFDALLHFALLDRKLRHRLAICVRQGAHRRREVGRQELLQGGLDLCGRVFASEEELVAKVGQLGADELLGRKERDARLGRRHVGRANPDTDGIASVPSNLSSYASSDSRGDADDSVWEVVDEAPGDHATPVRADHRISVASPRPLHTGKQENAPVVTKDDDFSGSDRIQESVHVVRDALEAVLDGRGRLGRLVVAELGRAQDSEPAPGKGGNLCGGRVTKG